jgi:uncharacterized protein (TIGR03084 family)
VDVGELCDDLVAERARLTTLLEPLDEPAWRTPTPAPGWTVLDQVTHVAFFDETARTAVVDPARFLEGRDEAMVDVDGFVDNVMRSQRHLLAVDVLPWLEHAGSSFVDAVRSADPRGRVPWYGPEMSLGSMVTSRIMETWAHGQDVRDALGAPTEPTPALRHVAFLGWRAFANSFIARRRPVPDTEVRVELDLCSFGPEDATDIVRGSALDFCLVVTQRRHLDDTSLVAEGGVAAEWLSIAQAYAGPPGKGRAPGQFT